MLWRDLGQLYLLLWLLKLLKLCWQKVTVALEMNRKKKGGRQQRRKKSKFIHFDKLTFSEATHSFCSTKFRGEFLATISSISISMYANSDQVLPYVKGDFQTPCVILLCPLPLFIGMSIVWTPPEAVFTPSCLSWLGTVRTACCGLDWFEWIFSNPARRTEDKMLNKTHQLVYLQLLLSLSAWSRMACHLAVPPSS